MCYSFFLRQYFLECIHVYFFIKSFIIVRILCKNKHLYSHLPFSFSFRIYRSASCHGLQSNRHWRLLSSIQIRWCFCYILTPWPKEYWCKYLLSFLWFPDFSYESLILQPESDGSRSGSSLSLRNIAGNDTNAVPNSAVQSPTHRGVHRSISASSTKPSRRASSGGETLRE